MYPIYIEQLPYQHHQSQLFVDDYAQIQHLLYQEQRERAALHVYHQEQEKRLLQRAMYKLQVLTELQRRREQEELVIRAYYENKRQQAALMRHRLLLQKQEEERFSRLQKKQVENAFHDAFIEHHQKEQQQQLLYALTQHDHTTKSAGYADPCQSLAESVADAQYEQEEEDDDTSEPVTESEQNKLEALVKYLLGPKDNEEEVIAAASTTEPEINQDQQQTMTLDEFIDYISIKSRQLDDRDDENNQQEQVNEEDINYAQVANTTNDQDDTMEEQQEENLTALDFEQILVNEDSMDEDDDSIHNLAQSSASLQNLVHDILTTTEYQDEFTKFAEEDPVKIAKFDALSRIEQELDTVRQQHEDYVLHSTLDFPNDRGRATSPDTILASTAQNREFLGYEDQIMKVMLKLDMIESDGDEHIRNERKALVKRAEAMLAKLDDYKQKEWERSQSDHDEDME